MVTELTPQRVACGHGPCEDDEAGRLSVEPLNDAERRYASSS
jgi:hypothetical protein